MNDLTLNISKKLQNLVSTENIQRALERACLVIENAAKQKCPVDTGTLRRSITHEVEGNKARVGTNLEYGPYIEFGTGLFAAEGNGRSTPWSYQTADGQWHTTAGQKPQPFLNPALQENIENAKREFADSLMKGIK